jgi:hypothetical protein
MDRRFLAACIALCVFALATTLATRSHSRAGPSPGAHRRRRPVGYDGPSWASRMSFQPGYWRITGHLLDASLSFVVQVAGG